MIPLHSSKAVYAKRRMRLAQNLIPEQDLVIFWNAPEKIRNYDSHYPYRPDSSFYYLTGFAEPHSAFLLWKDAKKRVRFEIFTLPRDPAQEQWDGYRYGPERARQLLGADQAHEISQLKDRMLSWLRETPPAGRAPRVWTNAFEEAEHKRKFLLWLEEFQPRMRGGRHDLASIHDVGHEVQALRVVKESSELTTLREAARINVAAHRKLMEELKPGLREYQVRAILEGEYLRQGALDVAYGTIGAAGDNATILHYRAEAEVCRDGELLLVDAGCEYRFYASDITRTLPVNGQYTREQRNIMDLVMEAHQEALHCARPGRPYAKMHQAASECLKQGLKKLKLLPKGISHTRYFPHGTGHWLGLDVHDPCHYVDEKGRSLRLRPGMVFTIEPGLYFLPQDRTVPAAYRGIGVRIEDDIVVRARGGAEVLTEDLPRTADDIEKAMK